MSKNNPGASIVAGLIPLGSVGVEIGVWDGDSSVEFLARCSHLHLVDPWPGRTAQYEKVRLRFAGKPVTIHRATSEVFFATFGGLVDWVYIDGLHDYETVRRDLIAARHILKPGGVIYGDDYGKKGGVAEAVDEIYPNRRLLGLSQYAIS